MSDEEKKELEEESQEEAQEEQQVEEPKIDPSGLSKNEPSDGTLKNIWNTIFPKKETEEESEEVEDKEKEDEEVADEKQEESEAEADEDDKNEEIDPSLVDAARRAGLSDEDIIKYAENDPYTLVKIKSDMDKSRRLEPTDGSDKKVKDDQKALKVDDLIESLSEDEEEQEKFRKILTPFVSEINSLKNEVGQVKGNFKESEESIRASRLDAKIDEADEFFDKLSEDFPEFEKTDGLPKDAKGEYLRSYPAVERRQELWGVAHAFKSAGMSFRDSLKAAEQWYKGGNTQRVEESLVKKLKNREKKLTPKKQGKATVKKYASEEERKADVVKDAMIKANLSVDD